MRRLCAASILVALAACSLPRRPVVTPQASATERLTAVDAELRAGCLTCLLDAFIRYGELRRDPSTVDAATAGAVRAAALIALRQRELGMVDEDYLSKARALAVSRPNIPSWLPKIVDIVDALPAARGGAARAPASDADLERLRVVRANRDAWMALLRDGARYDEAAAYTWLSLTCDSVDTRDIGRDERFEAVTTFAGAPLVVYREALCRGIEPATLESLLTADPRFVEVTYALGLANLSARPRPKLDEAERWFQRAYDWHPRWPALTLTMAGVAMTAEDFGRARALYDETLTLEARSVDALMGKVRALTYLGEHEPVIATADRLIEAGWYVGDARYWRALNETQLARYDDAWTDIGEAEKMLINAEVPKLAGIIAYRRQQLDVAINRFTTSRERNPFDCETRFYLGVVHAELRQWPQTADVLTSAATCLQDAEAELREDIERIRASDLAADRKTRRIAKREQQIADGRRMIATSWFDSAVAYFSLAKKDEARQFAEKVADDEQFGARAKELLSRLRDDDRRRHR